MSDCFADFAVPTEFYGHAAHLRKIRPDQVDRSLPINTQPEGTSGPMQVAVRELHRARTAASPEFGPDGRAVAPIRTAIARW
jgi:hypothetical protein